MSRAASAEEVGKARGFAERGSAKAIERIYRAKHVAGAAIWSCPLGGAPARVFQGKGAILGFSFVNRDTVLFTDGSSHLWPAHLGDPEETLEFTSPKGNRYCDVFVR